MDQIDIEDKLGLVFDDPDFSEVHRRIHAFNIFEAVGAVRGELRHSNFLAYILSPSRPHGLGSAPLVAFVRAVLTKLEPARRPLTGLDLIVGDADDAVVYRERANIDILIELPSLNLIIAIENKVGSKAGEGQLRRYDERLQKLYPSHRKLQVFLTPDGSDPAHDNFVAFDYAELVTVLESLLGGSGEPVPDETSTVIKHYIDLVRRHVVIDERLKALAAKLYERHKEAFDFIFECRPDPESVLSRVKEQIAAVEGLIIDSSSTNGFRFVPEVWDQELKVIKGDPEKWSRTGRALLFEVKTYSGAPGRVNLSLIIGPGAQAMRDGVYKGASLLPDVFEGIASRSMGQMWATIYSLDLITSVAAKNMTLEAQITNAIAVWSNFQAEGLTPIIQAIIDIDRSLNMHEKVQPGVS